MMVPGQATEEQKKQEDEDLLTFTPSIMALAHEGPVYWKDIGKATVSKRVSNTTTTK